MSNEPLSIDNPSYGTDSASPLSETAIAALSPFAAAMGLNVTQIQTMVNEQLAKFTANNTQFGENVDTANAMYNATEEGNTANVTSAGASQLGGGSGSQDMGQQMMQQMSQMGQQMMQPVSQLGEMLGQVVEPLEEGLQQVMQMAQQGGQQNPEMQQDQKDQQGQQAGGPGAGGADGKGGAGKGDLKDRVDKLEDRTGRLEAESPQHHGAHAGGAQGGPGSAGSAPSGAGGAGGAVPRTQGEGHSERRASIPVDPLVGGPNAPGGHVEFDPQNL